MKQYFTKLLISLTFFGLLGCGTQYRTSIIDNTVPTVTNPILGLFDLEDESGNFVGTIGISEDYNGEMDVEQVSVLRSQNFNGGYGTHPTFRISNAPNSTSIAYSADVNYSSYNDLEKDGTTSDLGSGRRFTVYTLSVDVDGRLTLNIQIHSGSTRSSGGVNDVVIDRTFKEII